MTVWATPPSPDLILDWLEISGFMSFPPKRKQRINLNTGCLTAIIGENLDEEGDRNGVGKSTIIEALLYLYFGRSNRLPNKGFLNYIERGPLLVRGSGSRDGIAFLVERGEKPGVLRLFEKASIDERDWFTEEDGKFLFETTKSSKPETTKRIVELIGFDFKLVDVLLLNTPKESSCFFLKDEGDQRTIVERVFGFTVFTEKAERLREIRKEENKNLATKEAAFIATKQANDRILANITSLEEKAEEWGLQRDKTVKFLRQQVGTYANIDFDKEIDVLSKVETIREELKKAELQAEMVFDAHSTNIAMCVQWDKSNAATISGLSRTIETLKQIDAEAEITTLKRLSALQAERKTASMSLTATRREIDGQKKLIISEKNNRVRIDKQIGAIEKQVIELASAKCPTCGQDWTESKEHLEHSLAELESLANDLDGCTANIEELAAKLAEEENKAASLTADLSRIDGEISSLPNPTFSTIEEAAAAHTQVEEISRKLEEMRVAVNPYKDLVEQQDKQLAEAQNTVAGVKQKIEKLPPTFYKTLAEAQAGRTKLDQLNTQLEESIKAENPHRDTILTLRESALKEVDETEIKNLKKRVEHMSLLITLLADRDSPIRKSVLNEWLPELNKRVNGYLDMLRLPHKVAFDADMTATFTIEVNGTDQELAFDNLSAGQQLRAWLATNMAFREIFELINYRINLFFVDELLDKGMSSLGAEVSYRMLEEMARDKSIFLITHKQELADIAENVITARFENKLTTLH